MYAIEAGVTLVMLWMRALPEQVALGSFSTELGDVKTCLYAFMAISMIMSNAEWEDNALIQEYYYGKDCSKGLPDCSHHDRGI